MPRHSPKRPATKSRAQLVIGSGQLANRKITFVEQPDLRPSGARLRKSLFDRIRALSSTHVFLDAFAGSGILGLTALSEGFKVQFAESHPRSRKGIQANLQALGFLAPVFASMEQLDFGDRPFIFYADPPFAELGWYTRVQAIVASKWVAGSLLTLEHPKTFQPEAIPPFYQRRQKRFSDVVVTDFCIDSI